MLRVVTPKKSSLFLLRSDKVIPVITNAIVITETNSLRIISITSILLGFKQAGVYTPNALNNLRVTGRLRMLLFHGHYQI